MCQYSAVKHVPCWGLPNIRCRCAKWSYLGIVVPKIWAALSLWHTGAYRGVRKEMRPVCQYRQHSFSCVHVVFHRSYAVAGGRNKPFLVAVLGLKGWRTIICWLCYIAWYVSCLGCYCTHVTWHNGTLKNCLVDVELSTSMLLFYSDILWDYHMNLEENLTHTEQDLRRTFIVFLEDGAV